MNNWMKDNREYVRIRRRADVEVETAERRIIRGTLRDISLKSLYIDIDEGEGNFFIEGEKVRIRICMRNCSSLLTVTVDASILRLDDDGFAAIFADHLKWWPIFVMFPDTGVSDGELLCMQSK